MKIKTRLCGRNWFIEAENGDRLDLKRGEEYTTSTVIRKDKTVLVFSRFLVMAPIDIFYDQD